MNIGRTVAWNIRRLRVDRNLSIETLAFRANLSAAALSRIELQQSDPNLSTLGRLARALGVPVQALFDSIHVRPKGLPPGRRSRPKAKTTLSPRPRQS